ncbi:hypothetical protein [Rhizobium johnstonii]|uniref:hypothetical protein n=1 Tax=Rhizobium johnstonii TaxID=3019933 RepID=UPI003F97FF91
MTAGRYGYVAEITRFLSQLVIYPSQNRASGYMGNEGLNFRRGYAIDDRVSASRLLGRRTARAMVLLGIFEIVPEDRYTSREDRDRN